MFVFPAFDSNYKTRKRTFKCCRNCRGKRMRCVQLENYENFGCDNCKKDLIECDLLKDDRVQTASLIVSQNKAKRTSNSSTESRASEASSVLTTDTNVTQDLFFFPNTGLDYSNHQQPQQLQQLQHYMPQHHYAQHFSHNYQLYTSVLPGYEQHHKEYYGQMQQVPSPYPPPANPSYMTPQYPKYVPGSHPIYVTQVPPAGLPLSPGDKQLFDLSHSQIGPPVMVIAPPPVEILGPPPSLKSREGSRIRVEKLPVRGNKSLKIHPKNPSASAKTLVGKLQGRKVPSVKGNTPMQSIEINHQAQTVLSERFTAEYLKKQFNFNTFLLGRNVTEYTKISADQLVGWRRSSGSNNDRAVPATIESEAMCQFLLSIEAFTLGLDNQTTLELIELYFFKFNSIFPIVREAEFWKDFHNSSAPNTILYAIILVASKDKSAENVFIKNNTFKGKSLNEALAAFQKSLILKIRMLALVLPELGDTDELGKLVSRILLVLHFNLDRYGTDSCYKDLEDSISIIRSLRRSQSYNREDCNYLTELWWICYFFERIGSIFNADISLMKEPGEEPIDLPQNLYLSSLIKNIQLLYPMVINSRLPQISKVEAQTEAYIEQELKRNEADIRSNFEDVFVKSNSEEVTKYFLPGISLDNYCANMTYLILRFCNFLVISLVHKYTLDHRMNSNGCTGISEAPLISCSNILKYIQYFESHEDIINISLLPTVLCLGVSVHLRHKFRGTARRSPLPPKVKYVKSMPRWSKMTHDYFNLHVVKFINELDKFSSKWWFVTEMIAGAKSLCLKLDSVAFQDVRAMGKVSNQPVTLVYPGLQNKILKIESLLTYDSGWGSDENRENENSYKTNDILETPRFIKDTMTQEMGGDKMENDASFEKTYQLSIKEQEGQETRTDAETIESLALAHFPDDV